MDGKLKILHLEDFQSDAELVQRELKKSGIVFDICNVTNRKDYESALIHFAPDMILSDHSLPAFDSIGALAILKEKKLHIPFILVTATISEEFAVEIMKLGASDYILKDRLQRLPTAISNVMEIWKLEDAKQKALTELQDAHNKLLFHIENTPLGFIEWDDQLHIRSLSKQAEKIFGWSLEEFREQQKTGYTQVYEEDRLHVFEIGEQLLSGKIERNKIQHRNYTKDGKVIWCEWFNSVLKDAHGKVITIMSLVQDITDRKVAEESLRRSESRLKEAQAIAHLGSWELDFASNVGIWSEEACRIYDLSPSEKMQTFESWLSFVHPDDLSYVTSATIEAEKNFTDIILNHRIVTKNGRIKHIYSRSKFELDKTGKPTGIHGISHDVSELKLTEENLKRSEARLKEAQAIAQTGNWEIDFIRNRQMWSDELYHIYGVDKNETEPSTELFLSFMHPEDLEYAQKQVQGTFETLKPSSFNFRFIRKDSTVRYGHADARFEFDKYNKPIRLYGIIQDITERKSAEKEREKIINDLIQRNKDLEQFSYIISHNLRSPVANIMGYSDAFANPEIPANEKTALLSGLSESANQLDHVIKDLNLILHVKREITERKETVRFSQLVEDIKISIQHIIKNENVIIKTDFSRADELFTLKGYLHSIFYNLISNSIKYHRKNIAPAIEITSKKENNLLFLFFKDNGLGIDLEKKNEQVFGLYKRFHTQIEGKGMGLFMTKTQVETLGGKINIESEVNKGTKFTIEFPI
jgi:PAS domain S-box-containing protein